MIGGRLRYGKAKARDKTALERGAGGNLPGEPI